MDIVKDKDIISMYEILLNNNELIMKQMVQLLNAHLRCVKHDGKIIYRTAEEDAEIAKRHTHNKPQVDVLGEKIDVD